MKLKITTRSRSLGLKQGKAKRMSLWLGIACAGLAPALQANSEDESFIDGVAPGDRFSYGVHELKWEADVNGNRLMDTGEVQVKRGENWTGLDAKEFSHTVKRRRSQLYMKNAYVYKKRQPGIWNFTLIFLRTGRPLINGR